MAFSERARSYSRDFSSHRKPKFQTKFKSRAANKSTFEIQNESKGNLNNTFDSQPQGHAHTRSEFYGTKKCKLDQDFN